MIKGLIKRWELNGRLLNIGDNFLVKYELAEHLNLEKEFIFDGKYLVNEYTILEPDSIYIDDIKFI